MKSNISNFVIVTTILFITIIMFTCEHKKTFPVNHLNLPEGFSAEYFYMDVPLPDGIAVRKDGNLLVVNEREPQGVYVAVKGDSFDVGDAFSTTGEPFESPDDIAIHPNGNVFVGDGNANILFKIHPNGGKPEVFVSKDSITIANNFSPFGITIAPPGFKGINMESGDVIVADNGYPRYKAVWAINPITGKKKIIAKGDVFIDGPLRVVAGQNDIFYIYQNNSSGKNRIVRLTANGHVSSFLPYVPDRGSMTINPQTGDLYFGLGHDLKQIWRISTMGGYPCLFASGFKGRIQDLEFSPDGKLLYVSAVNNVIEIAGPFNKPIQETNATQGSITGVLTNAEDKSAYADLNIAVYCGSEYMASIRSDEKGNYNLILPPGKYALKPSAVESFDQDSITVTAGHETIFNLALIPIKLPNILKNCLATYDSIQGYQDKTTVVVNMVQGARNNRRTTRLLFAFERPNKLRSESITETPTEKMILVSDGKTISNYLGMFGQYIQDEAPAMLTNDALNSSMRIFIGNTLVQKLALSEHPAHELLEFIEKVKIIKNENLNDIPVTVIDLTIPVSSIDSPMIPHNSRKDIPVNVRLWIAEKDFLIRKVSYELDLGLITDGMPDDRREIFKDMKIEVSETQSLVDLNPNFSDQIFNFVPPKNAQLVSQFSPPRSPRQDLSKFKGKPAPNFVLKDIDGRDVKLDDFSGKVRIVNFWATWCGPCREEIPEFIALQSQYSSRGFTMIGISVDQGTAVVRSYVDKNKINYPILMANDIVQKKYGTITAIPTTFVLDKNGIVQYTYIGMPSDKYVFQRNVEELLGH